MRDMIRGRLGDDVGIVVVPKRFPGTKEDAEQWLAQKIGSVEESVKWFV